jgi:hypothetical protein
LYCPFCPSFCGPVYQIFHEYWPKVLLLQLPNAGRIAS